MPRRGEADEELPLHQRNKQHLCSGSPSSHEQVPNLEQGVKCCMRLLHLLSAEGSPLPTCQHSPRTTSGRAASRAGERFKPGIREAACGHRPCRGHRALAERTTGLFRLEKPFKMMGYNC